MHPFTDKAALSVERVLDRCEALARFSEQGGGLTRVFLSAEHGAANELVGSWMKEANMSVRIDPVGNVIGRTEGIRPGLPCLMLGSHLDTVRDAGKYDGVLGVVAAIECVASLADRTRRLPFAIEVVGFADEEGVRFGSTLLGSRAIAGSFDMSSLDKVDKDGIAMREALRRFGLDPEKLTLAGRSRKDVLAYVELHIEQGPVLEREGLPVGVVTAISGASRFWVEIIGMAGHAGTVPMVLRHDALAAAAECVLEIERICAHTPSLVGTVGQIEAKPGAINVIPGYVRFTIDVRAPEDGLRSEAISDIKKSLHRICAQRGVNITVTADHESNTAICAPWLIDQIGAAIAAEGLTVRKLPSGAGHDGMAMIDLTDIGMLFVRCKDGISHHPAEGVSFDDVAIGARVFQRFIENFYLVSS